MENEEKRRAIIKTEREQFNIHEIRTLKVSKVNNVNHGQIAMFSVEKLA